MRAWLRQLKEKSYSCRPANALNWAGVSTSASSASVSAPLSGVRPGDRQQVAVHPVLRSQPGGQQQVGAAGPPQPLEQCRRRGCRWCDRA